MRLFIAIDLPQPIRLQVMSLLDSLPRGKPTPIHQLHLTLRFLGEIKDTEVPPLKAQLQKIRAPVFAIYLKGLGCFPSEKRPRILWAGILCGPQLTHLKDAIDHLLQDMGLPPEDRPFKPHLTLARFKNPHPGPLTDYLKNHSAFQTDPFDIKEFHLYSSKLTPKGAIHQIEATVPLS